MTTPSTLQELIEKWRKESADAWERQADMNARLNRGETVTIEAPTGLFNYTGNRFADELEALLPAIQASIEQVRGMALEEAAQEVDQCNREGPYNAIGAAERIRALATRANQEGGE